MGRVSRSSLPDGYFHVVSRGVHGGRVFTDEDDRRSFLRLLSRCETTHGWTCHAFSLLTTHYHLLLQTTRNELSRGMHDLNGRYAFAFNRRHGRFGHLFAERFTARAIESEEYLFEACSYVVLNPVRARMCERVEDWPWSFSSFGLESS